MFVVDWALLGSFKLCSHVQKHIKQPVKVAVKFEHCVNGGGNFDGQDESRIHSAQNSNLPIQNNFGDGLNFVMCKQTLIHKKTANCERSRNQTLKTIRT